MWFEQNIEYMSRWLSLYFMIAVCASCYTESLCVFNMNINVQIAERGLETSLVIEDDVRFEVFFKRRLSNLLYEVTAHRLDWDLM